MRLHFSTLAGRMYLLPSNPPKLISYIEICSPQSSVKYNHHLESTDNVVSVQNVVDVRQFMREPVLQEARGTSTARTSWTTGRNINCSHHDCGGQPSPVSIYQQFPSRSRAPTIQYQQFPSRSRQFCTIYHGTLL
jgi:hypothetical protein